MNVSAFCLTIEKLRALEDKLRAAGLSLRDSNIAVSVVKRWLPRDAEVPDNTPRDVAVPDEFTHP